MSHIEEKVEELNQKDLWNFYLEDEGQVNGEFITINNKHYKKSQEMSGIRKSKIDYSLYLPCDNEKIEVDCSHGEKKEITEIKPENFVAVYLSENELDSEREVLVNDNIYKATHEIRSVNYNYSQSKSIITEVYYVKKG